MALMTWTQVLLLPLAFLLYFAYGATSYIQSIKLSPYYIWIGLLLSLLGNGLWLMTSKQIPDSKQLFVYGVIWDFLVTSSFVTAAFVFGGISLAPHQYLAVALMVLSCFIMKIPA